MSKPTNVFKINHFYTKTDIYRILDVPPKAQKGAWNTGYREYNNAIYIFANIGVAGRTGHDYANEWRNSDLVWYSKTTAKLNHTIIQKMLAPDSIVHIFTRTDDRAPFTYNGVGKAKEQENSSPIKFLWEITKAKTRFKIRPVALEIAEASDDHDRKEITRELRLRKGQGRLRKKLLEQYKGKCCISGSAIEPILHACHILPHAESGINRSTNGLLLRSDLHDLFDANLIGIHPHTLTISIKKSLLKTEYSMFDGTKLARRTDNKSPDLQSLAKRWEEFQT